MFCQKLYKTDWTEIAICKSPTECNKMLWEKFMPVCDEHFTTKKTKI